MNFEELLKAQGLTDEQVKAVLDSMRAQKIYTTKEENIEERYTKLKTQKEEVDGQLKTANATITDLKKNNSTNEELQSKITQYEKDLADQKEAASKKEFDLALENELIKLNVHSTKAARAELDLEKVKYEDGQFTGLKEQTDTWAKEKSFLIKTGQVKQNYNPVGGNGGGTTSLAATIAAQRNEGTQVQANNPYASAWDTK